MKKKKNVHVPSESKQNAIYYVPVITKMEYHSRYVPYKCITSEKQMLFKKLTKIFSYLQILQYN